MGLTDDLSTFSRKIPDWGKWLGSIVVLGGVVAAVLARPRPVFVILLFMLMLIALHGCWIVLTRKRPSVVDGSWLPVYPQYRKPAIAVVALLLAGLIAIVATRTGREFVYYSFMPRPVLTDVAIASFRATPGAEPIEIAMRIRDAVQRELHRAGMTDVRVSVLDSAVASSEEDARRLATRHGAKAVIWGWYDDHGLHVYTLLAGDTTAGDVSLDEVPWQLTGGDVMAAALLRDQVAPYAAFVSLFLLGHLAYLRNDFQRGVAAFDAAMRAMPTSIPADDLSLPHFFRARAMQFTLPDSLLGDSARTEIICGYSEAIRLNPRAYAAYNNLAVFLASGRRSFLLDLDIGDDIPDGTAQQCMERARISATSLEALFTHAAALQPGSSVIRYNLAAMRWKTRARQAYSLRNWRVSVREDEFGATMDSLIQLDPTLPGPHLILGVLRFDNGDYASAASHFSAVARIQRTAPALFNLGQALLAQGKERQARQQYLDVLRLEPQRIDANLALAALDARTGRRESALAHLDRAFAGEPPGGWGSREAAILRSQAHFAAGEPALAAETLREWISSQGQECDEDVRCIPPPNLELQHFLLGLIHTFQGDSSRARAAFAYFTSWPVAADSVTRYSDVSIDSYFEDSSVDLAWSELAALCASFNIGLPVEAWGGDKRCLPKPARARIERVYALLHSWLGKRIHFRQELAIQSMECPFVFAFDTDAGRWRWLTTIMTGQAGKKREAEHRAALRVFDGRLSVREMEAEISYIDRLRIVVVEPDGRERVLYSEDSRLREADGRYVILRRGDVLDLTFPGAGASTLGRKIFVESTGYYEPLR